MEYLSYPEVMGDHRELVLVCAVKENVCMLMVNLYIIALSLDDSSRVDSGLYSEESERDEDTQNSDRSSEHISGKRYKTLE